MLLQRRSHGIATQGMLLGFFAYNVLRLRHAAVRAHARTRANYTQAQTHTTRTHAQMHTRADAPTYARARADSRAHARTYTRARPHARTRRARAQVVPYPIGLFPIGYLGLHPADVWEAFRMVTRRRGVAAAG